jgi:hypothetical protein
MQPRPTPGKMYALFPCPGVNFLPSARVTGSKGEPDANTHLLRKRKRQKFKNCRWVLHIIERFLTMTDDIWG